VRSPDGAQRNPGSVSADRAVPGCVALHPGYDGSIVLSAEGAMAAGAGGEAGGAGERFA
jgi:hypothetical protein